MSLPFSIFKLFTSKQRIIITIALVVAGISGIFLLLHGIALVTVVAPASGGTYTEGIVGQPSFINPVLAKDGTPDKDLTTLVFASLTDMAASVKHDDDYTVWNVRLKDGAVWSDNTPITSDDVIFTIQRIQNPDTASPLLTDWQHISVERVSEREVKFTLPNAYSLFADNVLSQLRPIPKKLFADISPSNTILSVYNLEPVGSGPYTYQHLEKRKDGFISSYTLKANRSYEPIGHVPYITTFVIKFYENEHNLVAAYNIGAISGFYTSQSDIRSRLRINSHIYNVPTTKYFALFLNQDANPLLADAAVRTALSLAVDKQRIVSDIFNNSAIISDGPLPPTLDYYDSGVEQTWSHDANRALNILAEAGWTTDQDSHLLVHKSGNQTVPLSITITTPDIATLDAIADHIADNWKSIGVDVQVKKIDPTLINDEVIKTRNYETLLFGNILSQVPDLFSFWHSSERFYPGLNLALYDNASVDRAIESLRAQDPNSDAYRNKLDALQEVIATDVPAIFLISPRHFYVVRHNIDGVLIGRIALPNDRFANIQNWYVKTQRSFR
jgi:peptide/nickel transport system substrate-binding protein